MGRDHHRRHALLAATGFGALAGLRSLSAPALLAHRLAHGRARGPAPADPRAAPDDGLQRVGHLGAPASLFSAPGTARVLESLAAGEIVADKLPWTPARIRPLPLAGRALSGALTGAAASAVARRSAARSAEAGATDETRTAPGAGADVHEDRPLRMLASALVGGTSAVATAFILYHLRRLAVRRLRLPDAAAGAAEDGIALLVGWMAGRTVRRAW